jgi:Na+/proline symporter
MARSDAHARKMLIFPLFGTLLGPLMWMLPPLVAAAVYSPEQIQHIFPHLGRHPEEGAFLLTAHDVLPQGMLGLLIAGIFGATLSNLDASMNQGVGILVRNFYLPVINPQCPEKKLLIISKGCTGTFGVVIIGIGLVISQLRTLPLFDLLNQLGVSLWLPLAIPMCLGLFYQRTPPWSSWTTVLIGLVMSFAIKFCTGPELFSWIPFLHGPFKPEEVTEYYLFATVAGVSVACISWFFFTSLFYESSPAEYKARVEEFFNRLKTPIEAMTAEQVQENHKVVGAIGLLCMIFGSFVLLMFLVPNDATKRLAFLFCGGIVFGVGWLLRRVARRNRAKAV